jgi:hypothetical protein
VATPPAPQPKAPAAATSVATMDASVVSAVNPQPLGLWSDAVLMAAGAVVQSQRPLAAGLVLSAATQVPTARPLCNEHKVAFETFCSL